jgi:hypothetical protein
MTTGEADSTRTVRIRTRSPRSRESLAGRFEIEEEAGSGGMAVVFRGHDVRHQRPSRSRYCVRSSPMQ